MSAETVATSCPECGQALVENEGFRTWCPECDWNLTDDFGEPRRGFVRRRLDKASHRLVVSLYEQLRAEGVSPPGWDKARVASYLIACGVHLLTVAFVVAAVIVSLSHPGFVAYLLSLVLLAVAFFIRPRFGRLPKGRILLTRQDAPELYRLLDRVADEMGARRVDVIVVDQRFNAAYGAVGVRRRHFVIIGVPLWNALTPEERISVLAHEMGHGLNGDSRHLLIVETALHTLERLYTLLAPHRDWETRASGSLLSLMSLLLRIAKWLLRLPVAGTYLVLSLLTLRAGQRAEYLADRLSAGIASPEAAADALDKLRTVDDTLLPAISFQAAFPQKLTLWDKHRELIARIPEVELERRRRISANAEHRVDSSHPPTHLRISMLRALPAAEPRIPLTASEIAAVEAELAPAYKAIAVGLAAPYRAAHYGS